MSIEVDLARRAAVHAALGDPARLQIVELLRLGHASPSELGESLAMPSNLLAHHLKALDQVGLLVRRRSEGDGRRSYLGLAPGALDQLAPPFVTAAPRVVFVCTANSARSHLAAALWRQASRVPVASAGTHPAGRIHPGAIDAAGRHHLALPRIRPRTVEEVVTDGDLLVSVCDRAHEELILPTSLHWSVPDPVPHPTRRAFDSAIAALEPLVTTLAGHLAAS